MFRNYFITALRNLKRNKVYSLINILGLSLGLAAAMLIILYVKDELSYDRFHNRAGDIYRIIRKTTDDKTRETSLDGNTGFLQGPRFSAHVPEIREYVRIHSGGTDIKRETDIFPQSVLFVDSNFFSVFSFPLAAGNAATCLMDPRAVIISTDLAKKYFNTTEVLGKTILLREGQGFEPFTISGVSRRCPQNSSIKFDMVRPFLDGKDAESTEWFSYFLNTFVVLNPESSIPVAEKKINDFYARDSRQATQTMIEKFGPFDARIEYGLQPYTGMHLSKDLPAQNGLSDASRPMYSYVLSGIAIFILLIACINFINLTVARSVRRAREIGIRKVIGSERKQLIFQFLGESFLLSFIAFLLALGLVKLILPVFNELSNKVLSLSYLLDYQLVGGYILLFLATGLLAGFYPAIVLSGYNPVQTLYSRFNLSGKDYLRKSLVVFQFALASFLIMGTFILFSQFRYLTNKSLGYDDSNMIVLRKSRLTRDELRTFRNEMMQHPSVLSVAARNQGQSSTAAKINGDSIIQFAYETIDPDYIPSLGIQLTQGRNFSVEFPGDSSQSVIVNESFVRKAGWKNPINQEVNFWYNENERYRVVGVIKDYHFLSLDRKIFPQLFTMKATNRLGMLYIKTKPGAGASLLGTIEQTFKKLFPISPYNYVFMDDLNRQQYEAEAKWKSIMLFGAILTIFVSCIGLFGLSVLSAEKRIKEIGIRKVLGASVGQVVTILTRDFVTLVAIALVIAIPVVWLVGNKWLEHYPYRISLGWPLFLSACLLVILVAVITVSFKAVGAALSNPVKSLRSE